VIRYIKSAILNFKNLISKSLSVASKTPEYEILNYQIDIKIRCKAYELTR